MLICVLGMVCLHDDAFIYALVMECLKDVLVIECFLGDVANLCFSNGMFG
jgi:hypothetical protein